MKRLIFLVMMLSAAGLLFAQSAVVGTGIDVKSGEFMIGVKVQIKGTTLGIFNRINAKYRLTIESDLVASCTENNLLIYETNFVILPYQSNIASHNGRYYVNDIIVAFR